MYDCKLRAVNRQLHKSVRITQRMQSDMYDQFPFLIHPIPVPGKSVLSNCFILHVPLFLPFPAYFIFNSSASKLAYLSNNPILCLRIVFPESTFVFQAILHFLAFHFPVLRSLYTTHLPRLTFLRTPFPPNSLSVYSTSSFLSV